MERLTKRLEDGQAVFHECHGTCGTCDGANCYCIGPMVDRLSAYEDTGLEPDDIKELCTDDVADAAKMFRKMIESGEINHLQDLIQAEQAGRLVVLPCKVGTPVHGKYGNWSGEVMEFSINGDEVQLYVRSGGGGFYCKPEDIEAEAALKEVDHA